MKRCSSCRGYKSLNYFHKNRAQPDGYANLCKDCSRLSKDKYLKSHPTARKDYNNAHKEQIKKQNRDWRSANKELVNRYNRKRYHVNIEAERKRGRDNVRRYKAKRNVYSREYYKNNKEKLAQKLREWRVKNPAKRQLQNDRRRAREREVGGRVDTKAFMEICEKYNWKCYLCETALNMLTVTIDHRIPLARGGTNHTSNIAPACLHCNSSKGTKTEKEYRAELH